MWNTELWTELPPVDELLRIAKECDPERFEKEQQCEFWERRRTNAVMVLEVMFCSSVRKATVNGKQKTFALEFAEIGGENKAEKLKKNQMRLQSLGIERGIVVTRPGWVESDQFEKELKAAFESEEFVWIVYSDFFDNQKEY